MKTLSKTAIQEEVEGLIVELLGNPNPDSEADDKACNKAVEEWLTRTDGNGIFGKYVHYDSDGYAIGIEIHFSLNGWLFFEESEYERIICANFCCDEICLIHNKRLAYAIETFLDNHYNVAH